MNKEREQHQRYNQRGSENCNALQVSANVGVVAGERNAGADALQGWVSCSRPGAQVATSSTLALAHDEWWLSTLNDTCYAPIRTGFAIWIGKARVCKDTSLVQARYAPVNQFAF